MLRFSFVVFRLDRIMRCSSSLCLQLVILVLLLVGSLASASFASAFSRYHTLSEIPKCPAKSRGNIRGALLNRSCAPLSPELQKAELRSTFPTVNRTAGCPLMVSHIHDTLHESPGCEDSAGSWELHTDAGYDRRTKEEFHQNYRRLAPVSKSATIDSITPVWMCALQTLANRKAGGHVPIYIQDLLIPGSHHSGMKEAGDQYIEGNSHFERLTSIIKFAYIFLDKRLVLDFVKAFSITQSLTIYQQLKAGIRYLDLRLVYDQDVWRFQHFMKGPKLRPALESIRRFLQESPKEVVFIDIPQSHYGEWEDVADTHRRLDMLIDLIKGTLGDQLFIGTHKSFLTLTDIVESNRRAVVFLHEENVARNVPGLWTAGDHLCRTYPESSTPKKVFEYNLQLANSHTTSAGWQSA
eukprot:GHVT01028712.1.p1 GENE.GHVT01028712.1~~GHVT01028712.1.p1  ORF type:complete len:410 (+),score=2.67 GHVT01028712.1:168-1397(+)